MWVVLLLLTLAALYRARSVGTPSPSYLHTATSVRRSSSRPQSERRAQRTQWTRRTFEQPALHSFIHSFIHGKLRVNDDRLCASLRDPPHTMAYLNAVEVAAR